MVRSAVGFPSMPLTMSYLTSPNLCIGRIGLPRLHWCQCRVQASSSIQGLEGYPKVGKLGTAATLGK